jgi:hypothetical protein
MKRQPVVRINYWSYGAIRTHQFRFTGGHVDKQSRSTYLVRRPADPGSWGVGLAWPVVVCPRQHPGDWKVAKDGQTAVEDWLLRKVHTTTTTTTSTATYRSSFLQSTHSTPGGPWEACSVLDFGLCNACYGRASFIRSRRPAKFAPYSTSHRRLLDQRGKLMKALHCQFRPHCGRGGEKGAFLIGHFLIERVVNTISS